MTSPHLDCISQEEYVRRIHAIADTLQKTAQDMADAGVFGNGEVAPEWQAAADMVRSAVAPRNAPEATPETRLGMSTMDLFIAREARSSIALDRDQTFTVD